MMTRYRSLQRHPLGAGTQLCYFDNGLPRHVRLEEEAAKVMTDLRRVPAVSIHPEISIDTAMQRMVHTGVRMLFVVDTLGNLVGLLTARDLMGTKPLQVATERQVPRDSLQVGELMLPRDQIEVLDYAEVLRSTVGDIVLTLKEAGRQHALVEEKKQQPEICGVFSLSQIGRQLGIQIDTSGAVQSFAELEQMLADHG